jgi:hypothetical protein
MLLIGNLAKTIEAKCRTHYIFLVYLSTDPLPFLAFSHFSDHIAATEGVMPAEFLSSYSGFHLSEKTDQFP